MKLFSYFNFLRNKFIIAAIFFTGWIIFFDKNDLFTQFERSNELNELKESKLYFQNQIEIERKFSDDLRNNPTAIEKFAREKYLMKRDNEDLFIIQPAQMKEKP
jgi:cell division protein FtsB